MPRLVCIDFETHPIAPRPEYPPEPVGVAIYTPGEPPRYLAWGHPAENNCTKQHAVSELRKLWVDPGTQLLFHNAPFDVSVATERMGMPSLPWHRVHDTMFLLFLHDPHAKALGLKPACEALLGMPPDEQDELYDWLWERRVELGLKELNGGKNVQRRGMGAYIALAPGALVGKYAVGDVVRTVELFRHLYPRVIAAGMGEAYDRERRLAPILLENERVGLRIDLQRLEEDAVAYTAALEQVEQAMRSYLRASGLNFDNDKDVASVFESRKVIHSDRWVRTPKSGQLSVSKENLTPDAFVDPLFASAFGYRNRLVTCLKMFMLPWLEDASRTGGYIHTSWNQVRGSRGGARTGRPSMSKPNLLNVSKDFDGRDDGYVHPAQLQLPPLPLVRKYVLPDEGHLWLHRDFSGQEVRIFAHFECGDLAAAYAENPRLDPHGWVSEEISRLTGREVTRSTTKVLNFQSLYGGGVNAVAKKLDVPRVEASRFKMFHDQALPGRKKLNDELIRIAKRGEAIRTWGGRRYYVEPPVERDGRRWTWEYKLINYLIQGSAADATKEAICRWYYGGGPSNGSRFLVTVYDEINTSAPAPAEAESMAFLRETMQSIETDVPLLSDGKVGTSWGDLAPYTD